MSFAAALSPRPPAFQPPPPEHSPVSSGLRRALDHQCTPADGVHAFGTQKHPQWAARNALLQDAQARLDSLPPGTARTRLESAMHTYQRDTAAQEYARLSAHVYAPHNAAPAGWRNISDDRAALAQAGLTPELLRIPGSNFRAQVYLPDPEVFGTDMKATLVFKGTNMTSLEDWRNNAHQALDRHSPYYERAVEIGNELREARVDIHIAGHSLGGGLASAAAAASGLPASTFNAAGLHANTVARYGGPAQSDTRQIDAWYVRGEGLNQVQEAPSTTLFGRALPLDLTDAFGVWRSLAHALPDAAGRSIGVTGSALSPLTLHGMPQVQAALHTQADTSAHALRQQLRW
ncbi:MAG: hypothetical protein Q4G71_04210 [Pseudomonadota bacterium]|nr:hypothetical protein [Pseudomonadota bacterium]